MLGVVSNCSKLLTVAYKRLAMLGGMYKGCVVGMCVLMETSCAQLLKLLKVASSCSKLLAVARNCLLTSRLAGFLGGRLPQYLGHLVV